MSAGLIAACVAVAFIALIAVGAARSSSLGEAEEDGLLRERLDQPIIWAEDTIEPALWCDIAQWQVVKDETCLYLAPDPGPGGYVQCRAWCRANGYGWLPIDGAGGPPVSR